VKSRKCGRTKKEGKAVGSEEQGTQQEEKSKKSIRKKSRKGIRRNEQKIHEEQKSTKCGKKKKERTKIK
jgi:hypothetical protein